MAKAYASAVVPGPVERVWHAVRDFDGLPAWHPGIAASRIEEDLPAAQVGCVRALTLGDGGVVRELLVSLNDIDRSYTYDILDSPFPIRSYRSTIRLAPITDTGQTFAEWWTHFDAEGEDEPELLETFGGGVFATGLKGLRAHFGG
jgi:hypothetical protein